MTRGTLSSGFAFVSEILNKHEAKQKQHKNIRTEFWLKNIDIIILSGSNTFSFDFATTNMKAGQQNKNVAGI
jgi:hypothetical protein